MKKMKLWLITGLMLLAGASFNSVELKAQDVQARCDQQWGPDSVKTIQSISVYREFYKQKNYDAAMESWRYVFANAPCAREQTHVDGVAMYKHYIKEAKDPALKSALIDTLLMIYEVRAANYEGSAGNAIGRKGVDMLSYRPSPNTDVLNTFKRATELGGNNTEYFVLPYYFKVALKEFSADGLTKEQILDIYDVLSKIAEFNIAAGNNASRFSESKQSLDADLAGNIIKDCDEILSLFEARYRADKDNKDLRDLIYSLLISKGCTDKDLFMDVAVSKFNESPSARLADVLARKFQQSGDVTKASTYYQKAIELAEHDTLKAEYYYDYATLYSAQKQFAKARQLAQEAIKLMPNWGKPYIFIGDLYASSYNQCGSGLDAQAVYWAAVDKYLRAKSIDPSVAEDAQAKISRYTGYFPDSEALFFAGKEKGSSFQVQCWIGETTTVRSSD